jgi:radical SAM superfamily enzyme
LESIYNRTPFALMTLRDYASIAARMLELLPPEMMVMRLSADCPENLLVAPDWCNRKREITAEIENVFRTRGSKQGTKFHREIHTAAGSMI